jgi:hypothetical protein
VKGGSTGDGKEGGERVTESSLEGFQVDGVSEDDQVDEGVVSDSGVPEAIKNQSWLLSEPEVIEIGPRLTIKLFFGY